MCCEKLHTVLLCLMGETLPPVVLPVGMLGVWTELLCAHTSPPFCEPLHLFPLPAARFLLLLITLPFMCSVVPHSHEVLKLV
uniref:Uncharacterized protein n=1 Tax=Anguilla anguilla TaxID=7936 RepID=A0A0E9XNJ8_ANGAN